MIDLDNECCIGCGACAELCPEVFEMDDRIGKARIIAFEIHDRERVEEAVSICPAECLFWIE